MMTIISILIALASAVWALIERYAKAALQKENIEQVKKISSLKEDLDRSHKNLVNEKNLLVQEKARLFEKTEEMKAEMGKKAALPVIPEPAPFDVSGLVNVTEEFELLKGDRSVFFEFYHDSPKEIRWRLKAKNNKILADSGEGYGSKQGLEKALGVLLNAVLGRGIKSRWKN